MASDSRTNAQYIIDALIAGDHVLDSNEKRRDPVIKIYASVRDDRKAIRDLLGESLNCCMVAPSGKLEVVEKDRLADLHKQVGELMKRAAHNEEVLDRFDAAYTDALAANPNLEPLLFSFKSWRKDCSDRIERGKNAIRGAASAWLGAHGGNHTLETIHQHPRVAAEIKKYQPIVDSGKKELPVAEESLQKVQAILSEAILPDKVDVLPVPNMYSQAISRPRPLSIGGS